MNKIHRPPERVGSDDLQRVKLVVWDLDETFWNGTLSEGPVTPEPIFVQRVKDLCDRGVMNSISSKNDFNAAKSKLTELGIWDLFVFPAIAWAPKGKQVEDIIHRMKLRAENVLVVDDNSHNLAEIGFHNTGIHVLDPTEWKQIDVSHWGKDDQTHSRLKNYKLLEEKAEAAIVYGGTNEAFLRDSHIVCTLSELDIVNDNMDRVVELLNRTNQLNFTKRRFESGIAQLVYELNQVSARSFIVRVTDNYGDYGLCGFVSIAEDGTIQDYALSCRLLDMGIETAILHSLQAHFPTLKARFANEIKSDAADWVDVRILEGEDRSDRDDVVDTVRGKSIFMPTACFSETIAPFLRPEFSVIGAPDFVVPSASLVRGRRTSSIVFWSNKAPEFQRLFKGEYDAFLHSVFGEVMYPTAWLPILGYVPIPIVANTHILKRHPDLLNHVRQLIADRDVFLGRRLDNETQRKEIEDVLKLSRLKSVAWQTKFSEKRYLRSLTKLRQRLPSRTKLFVYSHPYDPNMSVFKGPWSVLNREIMDTVGKANSVAKKFTDSTPNTYLMHHIEDPTFGDMFGHFSHKQYYEIAKNLKSQCTRAFDDPEHYTPRPNV